MLLSPRKNGLTSLFKEVWVFKAQNYLSWWTSDIFSFFLLGEGEGVVRGPGGGGSLFY